MNVSELRAYLKKRHVRGYSTMKKEKLKEMVHKLEAKEATKKYEEELKERTVCRACLEQQRIQRKIDEKEHNQRLLEDMVRTLVCEYCQHDKFINDGDLMICADCGAIDRPNVDYTRQR